MNVDLQAGGAAVAKAGQGEQGPHSFSLWEVETCIKAADLLLWPHIKQAKETGQRSHFSTPTAHLQALLVEVLHT